MCSSRGFVFGSWRFPQAAKSALPLKSKIEAKIAKFATRKICAFVRLGPCGRCSAVGAPGPHRGAGGLVVLRPSLKRVVPGSVPPWRAPCFAWPCRGFGLPEVFSRLRRGFRFQPLEIVGLLLKSLLAQPLRGSFPITVHATKTYF